MHYIALLALSEITSVRLCGLLFWYTGGFPAQTTCPPVKVTTSPLLSLNLLPRGAGPLPAAFLSNSQQQEEMLPELSASTVVQIGGQGVEESRPAVVHVLGWGRKRGSGVHLRSPIPDICHFFYTGKIFVEQNLHRKTAMFRVKSVKTPLFRAKSVENANFSR